MLLVSREDIESTLSPAAARAAIGLALGAGPRPQVDRVTMPFGAGELLLMPAEDGERAGVKVLTLAPGTSPRGLYVLFEARSLAPVAALDGAALTEVRTAAVSAWAADALARPEAATLALFGSGPQARSHLAALVGVRELSSVLVTARSQAGAEAMIARARELGLEASRAAPAQAALADIVCCCTSSPEPLFDGRRLQPGALVIAIGSHHADRREVDTATVRRSRVVVETRASALAGAGDLLVPMGQGELTPEDIAADLFQLAQGTAVTLDHAHDVRLFKSVGVAFEDLAIARAVVERLGTVGP